MKKIYYILLLFILSSCFLIKKTIEVDPEIIENKEAVYLDTIFDGDVDSVPNFIDYDTDKSIIVNSTSMELDVLKKNKLNKTKIIDKTDTNLNNNNNNNNKGTIAYSVPDKMTVSTEYRVKLRITKEKGKWINRTLILGDREIPIVDTTVSSTVRLENIRVSRKMSAYLISDDKSFRITNLNTETQIVENSEYTEWSWIVYPLVSGDKHLKLLIKITIDESDSYKDIVVFDKKIEVKSNMSHGLSAWFSNYWQWLISTLLIPIAIFIYSKREKGKKSQ